QGFSIVHTSTKCLHTKFAYIRIRIVLIWQKQKSDRYVVTQHWQTSVESPPRRTPARLVTVKAKNNTLAGAHQLLNVHIRGGGTKCRDGVIQAVLRERNNVHIPLHDQYTPFLPNTGP